MLIVLQLGLLAINWFTESFHRWQNDPQKLWAIVSLARKKHLFCDS